MALAPTSSGGFRYGSLTAFTPQSIVGAGTPFVPDMSNMWEIAPNETGVLSKLPGASGNSDLAAALNKLSKPTAFDKINVGLNAIGTVGGLYAALKQLSLANRQFEFQKQFSEANLANQIKSYNTTLADRARSRAAMEGQSQEQAQAYIDQNKMVR